MLVEGLLFQIQELRVTSQKEIIWMAWITGYSYDFWCFLVGTAVPTVSRFCCLKTRQGDGSAQGSRLGSGSLCSLGVPGFDTWPCSRSQLPPLVLCRGGSDWLRSGVSVSHTGDLHWSPGIRCQFPSLLQVFTEWGSKWGVVFLPLR